MQSHLAANMCKLEHSVPSRSVGSEPENVLNTRSPGRCSRWILPDELETPNRPTSSGLQSPVGAPVQLGPSPQTREYSHPSPCCVRILHLQRADLHLHPHLHLHQRRSLMVMPFPVQPLIRGNGHHCMRGPRRQEEAVHQMVQEEAQGLEWKTIPIQQEIHTQEGIARSHGSGGAQPPGRGNPGGNPGGSSTPPSATPPQQSGGAGNPGGSPP